MIIKKEDRLKHIGRGRQIGGGERWGASLVIRKPDKEERQKGT